MSTNNKKMIIPLILAVIMASGVASTVMIKSANADNDNYLRGWYTLFARTHCNPGDDNDGGCFCNNPNACHISFTTDPRTNEFILLDIIKSQGNGHFIPDNLRSNFEDISNSISNNDFDHPFTQCLSLEQNANEHIHLGCIRLLGIGADSDQQTLNQDTGSNDNDENSDNY